MTLLRLGRSLTSRGVSSSPRRHKSYVLKYLRGQLPRDLLKFFASTRAFEQLFDFCATSFSVVYPTDAECREGEVTSSKATPTPEMAVPVAVISPWTTLTVDLHPIQGYAGGQIYSRFMVEHEQRRRKLAYCTAAAGGGGGIGDDSFLSIHSITSLSMAGLGASTRMEESLRSSISREERNSQALDDAARWNSGNVHLSLVYPPILEANAAGVADLAVAMKVTAARDVAPGEVLWWECPTPGEPLSFPL